MKLNDGRTIKLKDTEQLARLNTGIVRGYHIKHAVELIRKNPTDQRCQISSRSSVRKKGVRRGELQGYDTNFYLTRRMKIPLVARISKGVARERFLEWITRVA